MAGGAAAAVPADRARAAPPRNWLIPARRGSPVRAGDHRPAVPAAPLLLRGQRQVRGDELTAALALERLALPLLGGQVAVRGGQVLVEHLAVLAPAGEAGVTPRAEGAGDQLHLCRLALHGALQRARPTWLRRTPPLSSPRSPMIPDILHIGPVPIHLFGIFLALGFL